MLECGGWPGGCHYRDNKNNEESSLHNYESSPKQEDSTFPSKGPVCHIIVRAFELSQCLTCPFVVPFKRNRLMCR